MKVRGTAATIADKYISLSRDAQSSGDRVAAENYLQHAEHYLRIVAANKPQAQPQPDVPNEDDASKDAPAEAAEQPVESSAETEEAKPAPRTRRVRTPRAAVERTVARKPRAKPAEADGEDKGLAEADAPAEAEADGGAAAA